MKKYEITEENVKSILKLKYTGPNSRGNYVLTFAVEKDEENDTIILHCPSYETSERIPKAFYVDRNGVQVEASKHGVSELMQYADAGWKYFSTGWMKENE